MSLFQQLADTQTFSHRPTQIVPMTNRGLSYPGLILCRKRFPKVFLDGGMAVVKPGQYFPDKTHGRGSHTKRQRIHDARDSTESDIFQAMLQRWGGGFGQGGVTQSVLLLRNNCILLYNAIGL